MSEPISGCITPVMLPELGAVSCRKCVNCVRARQSALVGRLLAEEQTSPWSGFVTLTYGTKDWYRLDRDEGVSEWKAAILTYSDVKVYLKRLRHSIPGASVRYFTAGEYGESKGRAHWHCAIFADREPPNISYDERYIHWAETPEQAAERQSRYKTGKPMWSEGFSYWEEPGLGAWSYIAKYIVKPDGEAGLFDRKQGWSSRPPLGSEWLENVWAKQHVENRLSPQEARYEFGHVRENRGRHKRFYMRSKALQRKFLSAFVWGWHNTYGNWDWPYSPMLDEYMEKEELRRLRRRWALPDVPDDLFNERFYMERFDKAGHWLPLLKDGGRSIRETFFRENYVDLDEVGEWGLADEDEGDEVLPLLGAIASGDVSAARALGGTAYGRGRLADRRALGGADGSSRLAGVPSRYAVASGRVI